MQAIQAALLKRGDVLFQVSFSGCTREILAAGQVARKVGAKLISLTNFSASPVADAADFKLVTALRVLPLQAEVVSNIATEFVLDALFLEMARRMSESSAQVIATYTAVRDRQL